MREIEREKEKEREQTRSGYSISPALHKSDDKGQL